MTKANNTNLHAAMKAKNDEFYTQRVDVEREMNAYLEYDGDVFKDKTILLPCDDPERSQFTRYFVDNFERLGVKKLISTSYAREDDAGRGRVFTLERGWDHGDEPQWDYLEGDGDFRSEEVTALRDEADMVITNPPFSKLHAFVAWLIEGGVQFSVIGNMNAVTYKEIFPLIKDNRLWYGPTGRRGGLEFQIPDHYPLTAASRRVDNDGRRFVIINNVRWLTNIEHGKRHEPLQLMTMADNLRHSRRKKIREQGYPEYDNYNAIEVSYTEAIPSDYDGVLGVPVSFLDKYNPEQFEIVGCSYDYGRPEGWPEDVKMTPSVNGKNTYKRILIRHK